MTTIVYCNRTKTLGADTKVSYDDFCGYGTKIVFPRKGVVLAAAGDAGEGEWLRWKLSTCTSIHGLYEIEEDVRPEFKELQAFVWWNGPYAIYEKLHPIPIETPYWHAGTGGAYALAYLNIGWSVQDSVMGAARLDPNSGAPVHVVSLNQKPHTVRTFEDNNKKILTPPTPPGDHIQVLGKLP